MEIFFTSSELFKKFKKDKDFYFIQFKDSEQKTTDFSYLKNFNFDNSESLFKDNENKMTITLSGDGEATLNINDQKIIKEKHDLKNIDKIKFFNYFFFENITKINIETKDKKDQNSPYLKLWITKNRYSVKWNINLTSDYLVKENEEKKINVEENIKIDEIINKKVKVNEEEKKILKSSAFMRSIKSTKIQFRNNREWVKREKGLDDIKYYGGIESFIPLFKIVRYILDNLKDININLSEQEKRNYINKSIIWIKDIIIFFTDRN